MLLSARVLLLVAYLITQLVAADKWGTIFLPFFDVTHHFLELDFVDQWRQPHQFFVRRVRQELDLTIRADLRKRGLEVAGQNKQRHGM